MTEKINKFSPARVKFYLKEKGLLKKDVAKKAGFKPSELSRYISGATEPQGPRIESLAKALGVTPDAIMEETHTNIYCCVVELGFTTSGIKYIKRDGHQIWLTPIKHIQRESHVNTHILELPDIFASELLMYWANGLSENHPAPTAEEEETRRLARNLLETAKTRSRKVKSR